MLSFPGNWDPENFPGGQNSENISFTEKRIETKQFRITFYVIFFSVSFSVKLIFSEFFLSGSFSGSQFPGKLSVGQKYCREWATPYFGFYLIWQCFVYFSSKIADKGECAKYGNIPSLISDRTVTIYLKTLKI